MHSRIEWFLYQSCPCYTPLHRFKIDYEKQFTTSRQELLRQESRLQGKYNYIWINHLGCHFSLFHVFNSLMALRAITVFVI